MYGVWHDWRSYDMVLAAPCTFFAFILQSFLRTCTHLDMHVVFANLITQSWCNNVITSPLIEHCGSLSIWSFFHPNSFLIFKNREQGVSPVFSVCNNFEGRKGSCCVVCCCSFLLSIHPVTVLYFSTGTHGSTTFVMQWFCLQQYTNTSTLTFIALRQLRCCWFRLVAKQEQRVSPMLSLCNNFEGRKGSCWVVCCCLFLLSSHPDTELYFSTGTYW